jgi:hypothetical protein
MYLSIDSQRNDLSPAKLVRRTRRRRPYALTNVQSIASLEEFMRVLGPERDRLALRRLSGERLTMRELARLSVLDAQLDRLLPQPLQRPEGVALALLVPRSHESAPNRLGS